MLVQKNIVVEESEWEKLKNLSATKKESISKIVRAAIDKFIVEEEKENLAFKMRNTLEFVDEHEQKEIEAELANMESEELKVTRRIEL